MDNKIDSHVKRHLCFKHLIYLDEAVVDTTFRCNATIAMNKQTLNSWICQFIYGEHFGSNVALSLSLAKYSILNLFENYHTGSNSIIPLSLSYHSQSSKHIRSNGK